MKKIIIIAVLFCSFAASAQKTTGGNYTYIAQRYEWLSGIFQGLGLPSGSGPADFKTGQERRAGAVYYDSVGIDSGFYVYSGLAWRLLGEGQVTQSALDDTAAAIRDYTDGLPTKGTSLSRYMLPFVTKDENGFIRDISNGNGISDSISLSGVTAIVSYGDSYTGGGFAEDATKIYPIQLRDSLGLTLTNKGVNAAGWYKITKTIMADNYLSGTRANMITAMAGILDVISNKSTYLNKNKISGLSRTFFANAFLSSVTSFGDAAVTNSGFSDTSVSCQSKSIVLLDSVQVAYASGSTLSFSFTGDNLVIGTFATSAGRTMGKWKIVIDGVNGFGGSYWRQYDGSETYANTGPYAITDESGLNIYPNVVVIRGLTSGAHTAVITSVDNSATYLDYFGVMATTATAKPVLVSSIANVDENTYLNYSTTYNKYINYDIDNINKVIRQSAADFAGYPISMVDVNKFYDPYKMVQRPDNLHPKTIGQNAIYQAFRNAMRFTRFDDINVYPDINGVESITRSNDSVYAYIAGVKTFQFIDSTGGEGSKVVQTLTYGVTTTWDYSVGYNAEVILTGNSTLDIDNIEEGDYGTITVFQDDTGNRELIVPGGTINLNSAANDSTVLSFYYDGNSYAWRDDAKTNFYAKSTWETPTAADNIYMWQTDVAITVSKVTGVVRGSSPSVTYQINFASDYTSGSPTTLFSSGQVLTNTTTGAVVTSFADATIPAGSHIWITTSAESGTTDAIGITLKYTID